MVVFVLILALLALTGGILLIANIPESKTPKGGLNTDKASNQRIHNKEISLFTEDISLMDFAKQHGPTMQWGTHSNKEGKVYHDCRFVKEDGTEIKVYFFSQLGVLTPREIEDRKEELYVGLMKNGKYYLHDENVKPWRPVDL